MAQPQYQWIKFNGGLQMKPKHVGLILMVVAMVAFVGFSATAYAGWGRGGGGCPMAGGGYGPRGFGGPGYGADLTDEEIATLQKERNAFMEQTREVRENLYQKRLELRAELAKQNPDPKKAAELQKEISKLDSELDQKRLDQQLKMKKEHPKLSGRGFGMGMGMGPGQGRGPGYGMGMGRGGFPGGGPWWQ
jgi:zinc resistance-associated protein